MTGLAGKEHKTDRICSNHAGEQDKHIGQSVELVEGSLIFFNQVTCLLTHRICKIDIDRNYHIIVCRKFPPYSRLT